MDRKIVLVSWLALAIIDQTCENSSLQAMELQRKHNESPAITNESLTAIYQWESSQLLYIPKEQLTDSNGKPINLKELFERYQIVPDTSMIIWDEPKPWNDEDWKEAGSVLRLRAEGQEDILRSLQKKVHLDTLPTLLNDAKSILKSFLSADEFTPCERQFIKKSGQLGRLFTYAKLQRVIEEKKLSHVHLPLKVLLIEDKKTGKYVENQAASKILDDIIKIAAFPSFVIGAKIHCYSKDYKLHIFAAKQENQKVKFTLETQKDLKELVTEAPFDVGYDNIFSDANGDAVIIDTEYKGPDLSVEKLGRYFS